MIFNIFFTYISKTSLIKIGHATIINSSGYGNSLTYAIQSDSSSSIKVTVDYSKIVTNPNNQKKYGKQIRNVFINLSQDKTNIKINPKVSGAGGRVEVDRIVP